MEMALPLDRGKLPNPDYIHLSVTASGSFGVDSQLLPAGADMITEVGMALAVGGTGGNLTAAAVNISSTNFQTSAEGMGAMSGKSQWLTPVVYLQANDVYAKNMQYPVPPGYKFVNAVVLVSNSNYTVNFTVSFK